MSDTRLTVNGMTVDELLAFHRARFGDARMEGEVGDGGDAGGSEGGGEGEGGQSFTQADVDKLMAKVRSEERRKASEKFADYDDLKAKASGAKSLEDRVAEIEAQAKASEARAMRAEVANAKGLTANQAKRLVGATREELEADADELLKDIGEQKKASHVVPREGKTPKAATSNLREFAQNLFGDTA